MDAESNHRTKGLLRLTMACNERCPFCNVPMEDYPRLHTPPDEIERQLDAFVRGGERTLTISGGEPTLLRARLLELVRRARARGVPFVELQTNAVLVDESYAVELAGAGLTSAFVSLLSHLGEHHDFLAGLDGAFDPCLRGIDHLLDAEIRVTLNPVIARRTQSLIAAYVDFVATRLPRVRSISLSAVQPHGRAAHDLDLLPDYDVLAPAVRHARERARAHGLELLNPYCGLPLCAGWEEDLARSVEAVEAVEGGWRRRPGIENQGDKSHGPPCRHCALRTRCGGAWHAYWKARNGAGLKAPLTALPPWAPGAEEAEGQTVVRCDGTPSAATWQALGAASTPTVWLLATALSSEALPGLRTSGCTDLALRLDPLSFTQQRATLKALRRLIRVESDRQPQSRLRTHVGFESGTGCSAEAMLLCVELAHALGVDGVGVLSDGAKRWTRFVDGLRARFPALSLYAPA